MTAWYVVYTRANGEAMALEHLRRQGYTTYLPKHLRWRRHARRKELVARPLFPRYLFVALSLVQQRWRPILSTIGVCDLLRRGDAPAPVPVGLVEEIQNSERDGHLDLSRTFGRLCVGDEVRVASGPFAELVGRVYDATDQGRVCLLLDLLGRQVKTCLSSDMIVPV